MDAQVGLEFLEYAENGRNSRFAFLKEPEPDDAWKKRIENEQRNRAESEAGRTRLSSMPSNCHIEHTLKCNFYCPHCSKGYDPYFGGELSKEVIDKALDALLPYVITADITGFGEPTIGSQYGLLLRRLAENGVKPQFNTNTSTLTIPHIEVLVQARARIMLSIDGGTRETFETIRAGGDWDRLIHVLHCIRRVRMIYNRGGWFGISFVAMRNNIHELSRMVRMAKEFGMNQLLVQDYQPFGALFDDQSLRSEPERANRIFDEAEALAKGLDLELLLPPRYSPGVPSPRTPLLKKFLTTKRIFPQRRRFPQGCDHPWKNLRIKQDGEVSPCCFSNRKLGDLKDQSFENSWNGWRYRFFRRRIQTFLPPPECRVCHVYEGINQGNPGNTMYQEGKLLKLLYHLESRWDNWKARRKQASSPDRPNFFKGKSLKGN